MYSDVSHSPHPRIGDNMRLCRSITVAVVAALLTARAGAQVAGAGTLIPIQNRTYIALNPLGIPFDIASAEMETAVAPGLTFGGVASYTDVSKDRYTSFDAKARFYPGEVVLRGFAIGVSVGSLRYSSVPNSSRQTLTAPTVGLLADYNWMLGINHRFLVGTGLGAKRILASTAERERVGLDKAYATVRCVFGFAF
jgi:hypothetical protein